MCFLPKGFPKYGEFWGTMGHRDYPWRPAVYLIVTLPVALEPLGVIPVVTTGTFGFLQGGKPATAEALALIGGTVFDSVGHARGQAWVRLESAAGQPLAVATADDRGQFIFESLVATTYQLRARAVGLGEVIRVVDVPSLTGEYDLRFP